MSIFGFEGPTKRIFKGMFEEIIRFCPLLNYANIARFYIGGNGKDNQVKAGFDNDGEALCVAYLSYNKLGKYICRMVYEGVYTPGSSYFQEGYYMNTGDIDIALFFNASVEESDIPENAYYVKETTIGGRKVFFYISEKLDKNCLGYSIGVVDLF